MILVLISMQPLCAWFGMNSRISRRVMQSRLHMFCACKYQLSISYHINDIIYVVSSLVLHFRGYYYQKSSHGYHRQLKPMHNLFSGRVMHSYYCKLLCLQKYQILISQLIDDMICVVSSLVL